MAVILSTTGIALLAYADGIATTKTLAGVVLAAASAAGSAVYKVFFKRVFGEVSFCQVAIFFSSIGLCSLLTLWTIFLALHLTGQGNFTDKRTDVWSRNFLIWKINFGLDCGKKGSGPILSIIFGCFFQFFMGKKKIENIVASALKSCIEKR